MPREAGWVSWAALGAVGWALVYADRAVFGPLLRPIAREFDVGPAALGLISTAFFLAYTALQLPAGVASDRIQPRWLLAGSFFGFGASVLLSGLAPSYAALVALAFAAGLFQSVYYPAQYAITSRTVPAAARGTATAVINGGMGVGVALGFAIGAAPFFLEHWRVLLVLAGACTIAVGAVFLARTPDHGGAKSQGTASAGVRAGTIGGADRPAKPQAIPWSRDLFWLCTMNFGSLFGFFFFLAWFPYYLQTTARLSGAALAAASALAPLVSAPAGVLWTRAFGERRLTALRLLFPLAGLSLGAMPFIHVPALLWAAILVYGLTGKLPTDPLILNETARRLPADQLGAGFGVLNFAGMLASVAAPAVAGIMAEATGTLSGPFVLSAGLLAAALGATFALAEARPRTARTAARG
ncbi:MAG: MFS transporter [Clostridia bacterium]|nr:MFS transporter [Clostridia bacterium]